MKKILFLILFFSIKFAYAQTNFYALDTIQRIEINFAQPNWDYRMDTARLGADGTLMAVSVLINGMAFDSVAVKYKGNSSYDSTYIKNPLNISLNDFKSQNYFGISTIKLSNAFADPSLIREVLSYDILGNYMDAPRANFAKLYINGRYIGLYTNTETINKTFCKKYFGSSKGVFVKANPTVTPSPVTKCNLKFKPGLDSTAYFNFYEIKSTNGWNELVALTDTVTNQTANISSILDMDRVIWMLAFDNILVNLDSYMGVFCQNYYLYKDQNNRFNPIVWDLNMSLGGFPFLGSGNTSTAQLSPTNMQQLSLTAHATDPYWPLINAVMANPSYKKMYMAHAKTIVNEMFTTNLYETKANTYRNLIDTAVLNDANKFFSYAQFQNAMTSSITIGSYTVQGIKTLVAARTSFLNASASFNLVQPIIANTGTVGAVGTIGGMAVINTTVTNATSVFLKTRDNFFGKFVATQLFDDGAHNDGASGDGVYGNIVTLNSPNTEYYIYAENANAARFAPERAEHEFYTIAATVATENQVAPKAALNIFPNPSADFITINTPINTLGKTYKISNNLGQIVLQSSIANSATIDISRLSNGFYYLTIGELTNKFVVNRNY